MYGESIGIISFFHPIKHLEMVWLWKFALELSRMKILCRILFSHSKKKIINKIEYIKLIAFYHCLLIFQFSTLSICISANFIVHNPIYSLTTVSLFLWVICQTTGNTPFILEHHGGNVVVVVVVVVGDEIVLLNVETSKKGPFRAEMWWQTVAVKYQVERKLSLIQKLM